MKVHINKQYDRLIEFIYSIPETFDNSGETIYKGRNTIKAFNIDGLTINVKSFRKPNIINRFAYRYIRPSKAERSFSNAQEILRRGINTPEPIAYIETYSKGLLTQSYYISIHQQVDGSMKKIYKCSEKNEGLMNAFIRFTAEIHQKGIYHKDYSPGNILFKKTANKYQFYLVDLNRMSFKDINIQDGCKSFSRLYANKETLNLISEEYSKIREYDKNTCQKLVYDYNRRFWKRHLIRHPECKYEFQ